MKRTEFFGELKAAEFENLAEIFRIILENLDCDSAEDFKMAKRILKAGNSVQNDKNHLIRNEIWNCVVFSESIFWDDFVVGKIAKAFEKEEMSQSMTDTIVTDVLETGGEIKELNAVIFI